MIPAEKHSIQTIKETFPFYIKDLRFHYGGVSFSHYMPALQRRVEFTIINYNIREEFDAIKNYFINALATKKIEVHAIVQLTGNALKIVEARSPQIALIDENLLQAVRLQFVKDVAGKRPEKDSLKPLLTMEEFFESLEEKELSARFYPDEKQLAEDLIGITDSKHYHQLRYLSSKHAYRIMRLRFILQPFSFLFLLEGEKHYHLVWETLDTEEATYIWPVQKTLKELKGAVEKTGETIGLLKARGKKAYLSSSPDNCCRIIHNYNTGIEGFIKWKDELNACLS